MARAFDQEDLYLDAQRFDHLGLQVESPRVSYSNSRMRKQPPRLPSDFVSLEIESAVGAGGSVKTHPGKARNAKRREGELSARCVNWVVGRGWRGVVEPFQHRCATVMAYGHGTIALA